MLHKPVLLKEVVDVLNPQKDDVVIDGTAGAGGHAKEILSYLGGAGKMLLVDWDEETVRTLEKEVRTFSLLTGDLSKGDNVKVVQGNYADIPVLMAHSNFPKADALLLDLGFSSDQLMRGRGFSFQKADEPLLMTYSNESKPLKKVLLRISEKELSEVIKEFGEERYAEKIAKAIIINRSNITTSGELAEVIKNAVPKSYERVRHHGGASRIHPATRTFQALRIYINKELENLEQVLRLLPEIVKPGGRVAIISFHSLEDRIVKDQFKKIEKEGHAKILTKKPIVANFEEVARNPRARSAKLRALIIL